MSKQGRYIVVEGLEGSGKTTALETIQTFLTQEAINFKVVREPGSTVIGEALRQLVKTEHMTPLTELLLMYAARVQLFHEVVDVALADGEWVISDRSELSSFAYQVAGRGLSHTLFEALSEACVAHRKPDLILFLDISPEIGMRRAKGRGALDRIEGESLDFFKRVQAGYFQALKTIKEAVIIDANQSLKVVSECISNVLLRQVMAEKI